MNQRADEERKTIEMDIEAVRRALLDARDARAEEASRVLGSLPAGRSCVFLSLNVPGPDKNIPGTAAAFDGALRATTQSLADCRLVAQGRDALGPWAIAACSTEPLEAKRRCVEIEERLPFGRLVDLDVFSPAGDQADRRALGLPPRRCLACTDAATVCIRLRRHDASELAAAAARLLECAR